MNKTDSSEIVSPLYVILGASNPQRYEIVWQMAEYLNFNGEQVIVYHHEGDIPPSSPAFERVQKKGISLQSWSLKEDSCDFEVAPKPQPGAITLFVGHGSDHLVDTLECMAYWLPKSGFQLSRITTWVDCQRVSENSPAEQWYKCCFHFSDLVILDEFKNLPVSWLKNFKETLESECYPFIIENTKKGRLQDLLLIMDDLVRRLAQVFETDGNTLWNTADDNDEEEEEEEDIEDNPDISSPEKEPYFERLVDGRRSKLVPKPL